MKQCDCVTDGVMHFTHNKDAQYTLLIERRELNKFRGKRDSGLRRFSGKVCLVTYCVEDRVRQN